MHKTFFMFFNIYYIHTDFLLASFKSRKISFGRIKISKQTFPGMLVSNLEKVPFLFNILSKHFTDYSTQQYCHVEFSFKFLDKMANKGGILKSINLCVIKMKKEDPTQPTITYAASVF